MFERNSRYANFTPLADAGFPGTRPRPIAPTAGLIEHTLSRDDRLDRLAMHYYNDPQKWWLILDANPDITCGGDIDSERYVGQVIVIPADRRGRNG